MKIIKRIQNSTRGSKIILIISGCVFVSAILMIILLLSCSAAPIKISGANFENLKPTDEQFKVTYTQLTPMPYTQPTELPF